MTRNHFPADKAMDAWRALRAMLHGRAVPDDKRAVAEEFVLWLGQTGCGDGLTAEPDGDDDVQVMP